MTPSELGILESDRWFRGVPADRRSRLLERGNVVTLASGARVYEIGAPPDGLWAVLEGQVRLVGYPAIGMESLALVLTPGTWFGELSTLDGGARPHDAVAFGPVRVLHVPLRAFEQLAAEHPLLYRDLGLLVCAHQRRSIAYMAQSMGQPVDVRLARTLAAAARQSPDGAIRLRQEDVAAMIGLSRQSTNKALKRLEAQGLLALSYGEMRVLDLPALRSLGGRGLKPPSAAPA